MERYHNPYIQIDLQATHRLPCVNLFVGFDLSHAPPKAVLVILVDAVGEGVLQEMMEMYLSCPWWTC